MKSTITKGLTEDERMEITQDFIRSHALRKRLSAIFNEKISSSRGKSISVDAYDSPNWALRQADEIGYERALNEVISLLSD